MKLAIVALVLLITPRGAISQDVQDLAVSADDGTTLHVRIKGAPDRDTIIVLHGGPGFSFDYLDGLLDPLERHFTVVYYDQRGSGRSGAPADSARLSAADHVEDLEAVRRHLGLSELTILGHSWGAGLAAMYGIAHPERVSRLVLVGPMPARTNPHMDIFSATLRERRDAIAERLLAEASERTDLQDVAACRMRIEASQRSYMYDPGRSGELAEGLCMFPFGSMMSRRTWASMAGYDWRLDLRNITATVLVIRGERDPIPVESVHEWIEALPNARLSVITRSGHYPFLENPSEFFDLATDFLGTEESSPTTEFGSER